MEPVVESINNMNISIHSLTRRLTSASNMFDMMLLISIHSLTRRLTVPSSWSFTSSSISIHSLTRRLTQPFRDSSGNGPYFNSQPHKEADDLFI